MIATEAASAVLHRIATVGTSQSSVYQYDITLTNQGAASLSTFWFGWTPAGDLLPSAPSLAASPNGWSSAITAGDSATGGAGIRWVTASAEGLAPGDSLSGFQFSSTDSPSTLANQSPLDVSKATLTAFVYAGAPLSDSGGQLVVSEVAETGSVTTSTLLLGSAPTTIAGQASTFQATVVRQGGATAPTGTVSFMDGIMMLGTAPVLPNGGATFSTVALLPATHHITAVYSGDATYAGSTSSAVTEEVAPLPKLSVSIQKATLPPAVVGGEPVNRAVAVGFTNSTGDTIEGPAHVQLYASMTGTIDGASALIGSRPVRLNLLPNRSGFTSISVRLLPVSLPSGAYTIVARVLGPGDAIADSIHGPSVAVAAPNVSLSGAFSKPTLPATAVQGSKTRGLATLRITNNGNVATSGAAITIGVFASSIGVDDENATAIGRLAKKLHIAPGKSILVTVPLIVGPALAAGSYDLFARVIDGNKRVTAVDSGKTIVVQSPA